MTTPLHPVDQAAAGAYWRQVIDDGAVDADTPVPSVVGPFGDSVELADELLALVLAGTKRATAGSLAQYELEDEPIPAPGDLWIVTDGSGAPRAVIRTVEVRIGPLHSVDDAFAWDEGEGDRTRASWLAEHEAYFRRLLPTLGLQFTDQMATVFERFDVIHQLQDQDQGRPDRSDT